MQNPINIYPNSKIFKISNILFIFFLFLSLSVQTKEFKQPKLSLKKFLLNLKFLKNINFKLQNTALK